MKNAKGNNNNTAAEDAEFLETIDQTAVVDLHRSNLVRMQAEELVKECSLDFSAQQQHHHHHDGTALSATAATKWSHRARDYVTTVTNIIENTSSSSVVIQSPGADFPFSLRSDNRNGCRDDPLQFPQSLKVQAAGCFGSGIGLTATQGNANVLPTLQLVVKLSSSDDTFLKPKDYLKHRYLDKRNRLVWHVACHLARKKIRNSVGRVYWTYWHADKRKPVLLLVPPTTATTAETTKCDPGGGKKKQKVKPKAKKLRFRVQLLFGVEDLDWIPPIRLLPNRCNLSSSSSSSSESSTSQFYNHILIEDAAASCFLIGSSSSTATAAAAVALREQYPNMQAATVLAKVWCLQRGFLRGHDTFSTDLIVHLLIYLFRTKQTNSRMAPMQVLAAFWKLLSETNWLGEQKDEVSIDTTDQQPLIRKAPSEATYRHDHHTSKKRTVLVMPEPGLTIAQTVTKAEIAQIYAQHTKESPLHETEPPTLLEFYQSRQHYHLAAVFLDSTMRYNYFGRLSPSFLRSVKRAAAASLAILHSTVATSRIFDGLFLRPARFWARHDAVMRLPLTRIDKKKISNLLLIPQQQRNSADLGAYEVTARAVIEVLYHALGNRVREIRLLTTGNGEVSNGPSKDDGKGSIAVIDSDEIPYQEVNSNTKNHASSNGIVSPVGTEWLVLAITLNPETCHRVVDRGPPADDIEATQAFVNLWGKQKAQLRRFKDGAIVHAVVWDGQQDDCVNDSSSYICFQNDDRTQGGIVERICRHILRLHFLENSLLPMQSTSSSSCLQFSLRNILSLVDGCAYKTTEQDPHLPCLGDPVTAHRNLTKAFNSLAIFLRTYSMLTPRAEGVSNQLRSKLGIPLAIDAVEPLSPALRYAELYPPIPHPLLGGLSSQGASKKVSGVVSFSPVAIQIRFGQSSAWPSDLKAMGAAKTAMLIQLVKGIEDMQRNGEAGSFEGPIVVTPDHADICFSGYVFRIFVRADPEIKLLNGLRKPTAEAVAMLQQLTQRHVVAAKHHGMMLAVYTHHASAAAVARLAFRWISSHLLSGLIPFEAIELLVAAVFTDRSSPYDAPTTAVAGFLRFLHLLATHDWTSQPVIVDPVGVLEQEDYNAITAQFEQSRQSDSAGTGGPPIYIVSPNDRLDASDWESVIEETLGSSNKNKNTGSWWMPSFARITPEWVVLARLVALAKRTYEFLNRSLIHFQAENWCTIFHENNTSFRSYSSLLRVDPDLIIDPEASCIGSNFNVKPSSKVDGVMESSYTRSMRSRCAGPKQLRRKVYRNLQQSSNDMTVLLEWRPVDEMVQTLRRRLGHAALFFYNKDCPEVVAVKWRPCVLKPRPFSAMISEYSRPITQIKWEADTLVTWNVRDILREMAQYTVDICIDNKVFDMGVPVIQSQKNEKSKLKRKMQSDELESTSSCDSSGSES